MDAIGESGSKSTKNDLAVIEASQFLVYKNVEVVFIMIVVSYRKTNITKSGTY